jgi:hypothetical protein
MIRATFRQLRAHRDARLRELMAATLADPDHDIGDEIKRIESYDRLLAAAPRSRWRELAWAGAVAVVCVSLLGAGLSIRVPGTRVVLSVKAGTATFALAEPWRWSDGVGVETSSLSLRELAELELPPVSSSRARLTDSAWMDVAGGVVSLATLGFDDGSTVNIEVGEGNERAVNLYVRGGQLAGTLTLRGALRLTSGEGASDEGRTTEADFLIPEVVSFRSTGHAVVPAELRLIPRSTIELHDMPVRALSLARDVPSEPGGVEFISTIDEGSLTLSDIGRTVPLGKGERLSLRKVTGRIPRLAIGERVELVFEGTAERVLVGPSGFEQDLTPTVLEYLYHNQRTAFLWSALAFIWGLLWSARRVLVAGP